MGIKKGSKIKYTPARAKRFCDAIASGKSMRQYCKRKNAPALTTIQSWLAKHEEFAEMYKAAVAVKADLMFEQMLEIADDQNADVSIDPDTGEYKVDGQTVARAKLQVETRKWMIGKMATKYADKTTLSNDPESPVGPVGGVALTFVKSDDKRDS